MPGQTSPRRRNASKLPYAYTDSDDFTVYLTADHAEELWLLDKSEFSSSLNVLLPSDETGNSNHRALACRCFQGRCVSVTVRPDRKTEGEEWNLPDADPSLVKKYLLRFEPGGLNPRSIPSTSSPLRLVSIGELCSCHWKLIRSDSAPLPSGLIVVAGRTASAKSKTARGLIFKALTDPHARSAWKAARENRKPHLITLEDPLEECLFEGDTSESQVKCPFDYTPRDKTRGDYNTLAEALNDALRQTPTVVYVGEVRDVADWKAVMEFAGTGHLIITTTHAGSVTETLAKVFDSVEARDPEDMGRIAHRILAVIHQAPLEIPMPGSPNIRLSATIPTIWRQTPAGIAGIISEGLSSVLPHYPADSMTNDKTSLGRRWSCRELLHWSFEHWAKRNYPIALLPPPIEIQDLRNRWQEVVSEFDNEALIQDLQGM